MAILKLARRVLVRKRRKSLFIAIPLALLYTLYITCNTREQLDKRCTPFQPITTLAYCTQPIQQLKNIQCDRLISGDEHYMESISSFKMSRRWQTCNLTTYISNCSKFISDHGYHDKPVTEEELKFPLAFGIKVHKTPALVEQLLRTIYRPHNVYCIHVDLKAETDVYESLKKVAGCFDNVYVIHEYRVVYSSIRQPLADIACMKTVTNTKVDWRYYLILAGEEFVLKTNLEIVQILKILNGTNDISKSLIDDKIKHWYGEKYVIVNDSNVNDGHKQKRPFSRNIKFYKGSAYGMFSKAFVKFILESDISRELLQWANDTYAPEEIIWATLNSLPEAPGGHDVFISHGRGNFLSRTMIWNWEETKCHGVFSRNLCIFSYRDLPWLVSLPQVVANKFQSSYDQLVVDCLEEWIRNKTLLATTVNLNWFYYRNLPHVQNQWPKHTKS